MFKLLASRELQPSRACKQALEQRAQARLRSRGIFPETVVAPGTAVAPGRELKFLSQLALYLEKNIRDFSKSTKYFILLSSDHVFSKT
jgi:hypothetical protein